MSAKKPIGKNPFADLNLENVVGPNGKVSEEVPPELRTSSPELSTPAGNTRRSRVTSGNGTFQPPSTSASKSAKRKGDGGKDKNVKKSRTGSDGSDEEMDTSGSAHTSGAPNDPFARMQSFIENQFKTTNDNIRKMNNSIGKVNEKVGINVRNLARLKQTVEKNSDNTDIEIQNIHATIDKKEGALKKEIDELKATVSELKKSSLTPVPGSAKTMKMMEDKLEKLTAASIMNLGARALNRDEEYIRARRSLRIWPINTNDGAISTMEAAMNFLYDAMRIASSNLREDEIVDARMVAKRPRRRRADSTSTGATTTVHGEAIVRFSTIQIRDYVMGQAVNLGTHVDLTGKPEAGIRIEVPEHLNNEFRDFLSFGRAMYKKHGSGFKRHIKFDDRKQCMYMDMKLPGDDEWLFVDQKLATETPDGQQRRCTTLTRKRLTSSQSSRDNEVELIEAPLQTSTTLAKFRANRDGAQLDWE